MRLKGESAALDECISSLTSHLGRAAACLLEKYGAHGSQLRPVLGLIRQLCVSAHAGFNGKRFDEVLEHLEATCLKHVDETTLSE